MSHRSGNSKAGIAWVAGNGLLDRRLFLAGSTGMLATVLNRPSLAAGLRERLAESQKTPGAAFTNYGSRSPHESSVVRWISADAMAPGNGISWSPVEQLEGMITPNGLHFERHHNGIPDIDPAAHRLEIGGAVAQALSFDLEALDRYPRHSRVCFIECGGNSNAGWRRRPVQASAGNFHGLVSCSEWTGVPLSTLLEQCRPEARARWLIAEGADAFSLSMSIPLDKALSDCMVALFQNGERIRPSQGYPMRLLVPGWEGVLNVKWLKRLTISEIPAMARNETSKYTELQPDGRARQFTFTMGPKSLITRPSAMMRLDDPGFYEISGLAWSGHGRVASVEVSADGGDTWAEAALAEPVLPAALTRFRIPWEWTGESAVLQSRVRDEFGHEQPTRKALMETRGRHGYYHYNAIVSWAVDETGLVEHVYPEGEAASTELEDLFMDDAWD